MTNPIDTGEEVKQLFHGAMPERIDEVDALVEKISYQRASDRPGFHLETVSFTGAGLVALTDRTMQQIWLISYLAWQALREQSGFLIVFQARGKPYDLRAAGIDISNDHLASKVDRLSCALGALRDADSGQLHWSTDVPKLTPDLAELRDEEDRIAYDLGLFATAFALLHESCHALKPIDGIAYGGVSEELECDRYAFGMLLGHCDQHAAFKKYNPMLLRRKRAMGAFLGLIVILESTSLGLSAESLTHPPFHDRVQMFTEVAECLELSKNDDFWIFATCGLISKLRREDLLPSTVDFDSFRDLFDSMLVYCNKSKYRD